MNVTPPNRYRLYIDESGDHAFKLLHDPSHRFLGLLGVWFLQTTDYVEFADGLEGLKRNIFGPRPDKPVVLHRSDIINRKGPFGILQKPEVEEEFNTGLLKIVSSAKFRLVCVVIDKKVQFENYSSPFHPYHYCLAAMLERYCGWLNHKNAAGDVMAEARGRQEDLQLRQAYLRVYESGTLFSTRQQYQRVLTSKSIKIQPKTMNIAGLQLADILAHPVKQQCLAEKRYLQARCDVFGTKVCEAVKDKFNINELNGEAWGYGKKILSK